MEDGLDWESRKGSRDESWDRVEGRLMVAVLILLSLFSVSVLVGDWDFADCARVVGAILAVR